MSTPEFFRVRLADMVDLRHPLAVLATRIPWQTLEATSAPTFARKQRPGVDVAVEDLFGPSLQLAGAPLDVRVCRCGVTPPFCTPPATIPQGLRWSSP